MQEVVIVSAVRTAIGSFGGSLANLSAVSIGSICAAEAIRRAGIEKTAVEEVIVGNVLSAGLGQNVARQVALNAGLPVTVSALTVNEVCGSGLRAVMTAVQMIKAGDAEIVLAGGTESMSNAPYVLDKARTGYRMGDGKLVDVMIKDGLWDAFNDYHMGITAENIAERWQISREAQDQFAAQSQQRAEAASQAGKFTAEIVPVPLPAKKGVVTEFSTDEYIRAGVTAESLAGLRPAFKKDGTVTAGNASGINDGAAMLVLMSADKAQALGLKPLARVISYASVGLEPEIMGYGPVPASQKALTLAGLTVGQLDRVEANEAFAVQSLAVTRDLGLDPQKTNPDGGAIALGHPIGASGARVLTTLVHGLVRDQGRYGLATLCIGGGLGVAMIVERID